MAVFEVYAGDLAIHHSQSPHPDVKLLNPKLTLEVNSAGSFSCKIPPNNVGYDTVDKLTSEITVKKDGIWLWSGRIITEEMDFWNNRSITCEGELAYLNDTTQPPAEYHNMTVRGFLDTLLTIHNNKVSSNKKFQVGVVTVTDPNDSLYRYTNFESTLEAISDKMLDRLGGYLRVRRENDINYIDYLAEPLNTNSQVIEFGKNLLEFSKSWDLTDFATVVVPQGAMLDESPIEALDTYLDVSSVNDGSIYVYDQATVNTYGWIEVVVSWSEVTQASNLLSKAKKYLSDIQFDTMELEVSAVDMSYMMNGDSTEMIKLFDKIHCKSTPHGMDRYFPVMKIDMPIDNPEKTTFTLGDSTVKTSLSASIKNGNEAIKKLIDAAPSTTSTMNKILNEAKANADQLMHQVTNGYITIDTVETADGIHSEALYISDNVDIEESKKNGRYWMWNINGLAYYKNGTDLGLALTMDGAIVADKITTGTLNANVIRAGKIEDAKGYNYWNLETGELRMMAGHVSIDGNAIATQSYATNAANTAATNKVNAYNNSLTQTEIFNRLTNNGAAQGLAIANGQLYINASYINTGIVTDVNGNMTINLTDGKIVTQGKTSGSTTLINYYSEYDGGVMSFYKQRTNTKRAETREQRVDVTYEGLNYYYNDVRRGRIRLSGNTYGLTALVSESATWDLTNQKYYYTTIGSVGTVGHSDGETANATMSAGNANDNSNGNITIYGDTGSIELYSEMNDLGSTTLKLTSTSITIDTRYSRGLPNDCYGEFTGYSGWFSNGHGVIKDTDGYYHDLLFVNGLLVRNNIWS